MIEKNASQNCNEWRQQIGWRVQAGGCGIAAAEWLVQVGGCGIAAADWLADCAAEAWIDL